MTRLENALLAGAFFLSFFRARIAANDQIEPPSVLPFTG